MIWSVLPADEDLLDRAVRRFGAGNGAAAFVPAPGALAFVAADEDGLLGWCWGHVLARPDGSSMVYLHHLEVAEQNRRRGIGRALLRAFMEAGAEFGATRMFLITGEANAGARHLYETMGATVATQGPTVNYWFPLTKRTGGTT
ncbi:GNAT family N-acetyltransferase [Actinoplanes sp. NBRC 101535]|uniref:GNAT family N-acetyltransferase n=1 Tax=Actinoplanes sp. NBRC 101535 TaxID=3032196 RepID=UPI0024A524F2|nr:GNAT family N-acetyltransferase [Actinoplanes sp. NBRC 101535]GLY03181.1 hypothetical protein Acsp01_35600 [Actinoplanes sp. NBRC 101535]